MQWYFYLHIGPTTRQFFQTITCWLPLSFCMCPLSFVYLTNFHMQLSLTFTFWGKVAIAISQLRIYWKVFSCFPNHSWWKVCASECRQLLLSFRGKSTSLSLLFHQGRAVSGRFKAIFQAQHPVNLSNWVSSLHHSRSRHWVNLPLLPSFTFVLVEVCRQLVSTISDGPNITIAKHAKFELFLLAPY